MTSRIPESRSPDAVWSERERELLDAGRHERMPAALEARLREALDLPPGPTTPSTSQPDAAARGSLRARELFVGKLPLWGVLSIIAVGAVSYFALTRAAQERWSSRSMTPALPLEAAEPVCAKLGRGGAAVAACASATSEGAALQLSASASGVSAAEGGVVMPLTAGVAARARTAGGGVPVPVVQEARARKHAAYGGMPAAPDQLRIEAELLASVRRALGQRELERARQGLARYAAQFEHGALQPESDVLGIELKMRTGAKVAAKAQAERFIAQHPNHPLRERVRELVSAR